MKTYPKYNYRFILLTEYETPLYKPRIPNELSSRYDVSEYLKGTRHYALGSGLNHRYYAYDLRSQYTLFFIKEAISSLKHRHNIMVDFDELHRHIMLYGTYKTLRSYFTYLDIWFWSTHTKFLIWLYE